MVAGRVPTPMSRHAAPPTYIPKDLASCKYVFVRVDKVVDPLASKYTVPYRVLETHEKAYKLDYRLDDHGNYLQEWVSIGILKPAYTDADTFGNEETVPAPA